MNVENEGRVLAWSGDVAAFGVFVLCSIKADLLQAGVLKGLFTAPI